ncbi:unnamed protein product [Brachionus calyciflorus]|uniref:Uncharacterized protein n=1 Tax=Brachionus calyciflorus TaxID=104777 RepID=A0A813RZN3_9BILA|nr:unnamed protein product [Brachionus calyciflorus]
MEEDDYESLPPNASSLDHMLAGAAAGVMEHCIIYPVDVVKTRMQCLKPDPNARYNGIIDAFVKIVRNEGAFRPVRGMGVVAFGAGPAHALYFSCYEFIKNNFSGSQKAGENSKINFIAGCFATLLHDAVMVPSDTIKQRLQMYNSPYKGIIDCVVRTTQREGFRAFYRSYFTQLSMNIPFQTTHLVTYDFLQTHINKKREYNPLSHCISGAIAGAIAAAVTTPLDVCKTLINTQECCNPDELCKGVKSTFSNKINFAPLNANFVRNTSNMSTPGITASGLRDAVYIIYKHEGLRGFFKGIAPRTLFQIPGTAVSWSVYEYFKHSLNKNKYE